MSQMKEVFRFLMKRTPGEHEPARLPFPTELARLGRAIAPAALLLLSSACDGPVADTPGNIVATPEVAFSEVPADGMLLVGDGLEVAKLELPNGSTLHFLELAPGEIGTLELKAPGAVSISALEELRHHASPADIFHAFSREGTELPERLLDAGPRTASSGIQGWALQQLERSPVTQAACNDTDVRNYVNSFGYNDRGTPDFRLNQIPDSSGYFVPYVENWEPGYYFYEYQVGEGYGSTWYNVDRYLTYVAACVIDSYEPSNPGNQAHPSIDIPFYSNDHMGPQVRVSYRRQNTDGQFQTAFFKDFAANEAGTAVSWHFYTGLDWDWRTEIHWAGGDDRFDIAHALEDL